MQAMAKVRALSRWLLWGANLALVVLPLAAAGGLLALLNHPEWAEGLFAGLPAVTAFSAPKVGLAAAMGLLALIPALYALLHMRRLFRLYLAGQVLTAPAARHIRQIGLALVTIGCTGPLIPTLQTLIMTADNPAGQRMLQISLSSDNLGFLLAGGLLTVVGWAMTEAARVAEDNQGFV
ncbi:MAG: DUF2975 domain-containing protein [Paracoccaceae bacterium]